MEFNICNTNSSKSELNLLILHKSKLNIRTVNLLLLIQAQIRPARY